MTTEKNETGRPAAPLAVATLCELTEDDLENVSGGALKTYLRTPDFTPIGTQ